MTETTPCTCNRLGMTEEQQEEVNEIVRVNALPPTLADFVQDLCANSLNYHEHAFVWEAVYSVVETFHRGDFADILIAHEVSA